MLVRIILTLFSSVYFIFLQVNAENLSFEKYSLNTASFKKNRITTSYLNKVGNHADLGYVIKYSFFGMTLNKVYYIYDKNDTNNILFKYVHSSKQGTLFERLSDGKYKEILSIKPLGHTEQAKAHRYDYEYSVLNENNKQIAHLYFEGSWFREMYNCTGGFELRASYNNDILIRGIQPKNSSDDMDLQVKSGVSRELLLLISSFTIPEVKANYENTYPQYEPNKNVNTESLNFERYTLNPAPILTRTSYLNEGGNADLGYVMKYSFFEMTLKRVYYIYDKNDMNNILFKYVHSFDQKQGTLFERLRNGKYKEILSIKPQGHTEQAKAHRYDYEYSVLNDNNEQIAHLYFERSWVRAIYGCTGGFELRSSYNNDILIRGIQPKNEDYNMDLQVESGVSRELLLLVSSFTIPEVEKAMNARDYEPNENVNKESLSFEKYTLMPANLLGLTSYLNEGGNADLGYVMKYSFFEKTLNVVYYIYDKNDMNNILFKYVHSRKQAQGTLFKKLSNGEYEEVLHIKKIGETTQAKTHGYYYEYSVLDKNNRKLACFYRLHRNSCSYWGGFELFSPDNSVTLITGHQPNNKSYDIDLEVSKKVSPEMLLLVSNFLIPQTSVYVEEKEDDYYDDHWAWDYLSEDD